MEKTDKINQSGRTDGRYKGHDERYKQLRFRREENLRVDKQTTIKSLRIVERVR